MLSVTTLFSYEERNILLNQISREQLKDALVLNQEWVVYPSYYNRQGWDEFLGDLKDYYIKRGEKRLDYVWKVIKATDYIEYERSGNRNIMENPLNSNNKAIADLLIAELAEGKGRFTDQLINGVFHSCEMTSWALSAHVYLTTKRALPSYCDNVFDLTNGEMGNLLSWTYYFMKGEFDKVCPEIARRLRYELEERILKPYFNNDFGWMARQTNRVPQNNWNPWCNSNALISFMLLENDREVLANAVYESMRSVDQYLNYVKSDGACEEGPSYWASGPGRLLDYLQMLSSLTCNKVNIFDNMLIKNMGEYICRSYVGNGWFVNFADASAQSGGDPYLAYRYGEAVRSEQLINYSGLVRGNYNAPVPSTSMYRFLKALEVKNEISTIYPVEISKAFTWYPETEYCYLTNEEGLFLAAKGGFNNESHNHNDVGSFNLYIDQIPVLIDVGVGSYTRQTFSSGRYEIWTMQSNYHNLPMINGVPEKEGKQYKSRNVIAKSNFFSLDISRAYPETAQVNKWIRSYTLDGRNLTVTDDFRLNEALSPNIINFMTWGDVKKKQDGLITLSVNTLKAQLLYDHSVFNLQIDTIPLKDRNLSRVWGENVYRISFTAKSICKNGRYKFKIMKL